MSSKTHSIVGLVFHDLGHTVDGSVIHRAKLGLDFPERWQFHAGLVFRDLRHAVEGSVMRGTKRKLVTPQVPAVPALLAFLIKGQSTFQKDSSYRWRFRGGGAACLAHRRGHLRTLVGRRWNAQR